MSIFGMNVEDMPEFVGLASGEYEITVEKAEATTSKNNDPMLVLFLSVISEDPDFNNQKLRHYNMLPDKNSEHYDLQLKSTRAMCETLGITGDPEIEDFAGLTGRILVQAAAEEGGFPQIKRFLK